MGKRKQSAIEPMAPYLSSREIAKLLRVSPDKVLGWIRGGALKAVNVGNTSRPQYRVSTDALEEFLTTREVQIPPKRSRARRQEPEGGPLDPALGKELLKKGRALEIGNAYYRVWNGMTLFY